MSTEVRFGRSVAWMAVGSWVEQGCNILFFVLLARILGAEAFGLVAMATAFVIFAESLVRESVSEYLIAARTPAPGHFSAAFWMLSGVGLVLMLALMGLSGPIARFYGEPVVADVLWWFSPTVLCVALNAVPVAILRRNMAFKILSLRAVAGVVIGGMVGTVLALSGAGVWALVAQQVTLIVVNALIAWIWASWWPSLRVAREQVRVVVGFGSQVLALRVAELVALQTPIVLIGSQLGPTALGVFSISWRLIEIGSFLLVTPLRMASQSAFAALNRDGGGAADLLREIGRLSSLVAFPAFAGLAVVAGPFVLVVFGDGWRDAGPVLMALSPLGFYLCIERVQQAFCLAAGRAGALTVLAWAEVVLGIVLILLASNWGLVAVTVAAVLRYFLLWPLRFLIVSRLAQLPVRALVEGLLAPALGAGVMVLVVVAVLGAVPGWPELARLLLGAGTGTVVFGCFAALALRDRLTLLYLYATGQRH